METVREAAERRLHELKRRIEAAEAAGIAALSKVVPREWNHLGPPAPAAGRRDARPPMRPDVIAPRNNQRGTQARNPATDVAGLLDRSPSAKAAAGEFGLAAGRVPGVVRGAWHTLGGAVELGDFVSRVQNPVPDILAGRETAPDQVIQAGRGAIGYFGSRASNPGLAVNDVQTAYHRANVSLNPSASPQADTVIGEFKRNRDIGLNQGEVAFDVYAPTKVLKVLAPLRQLSRAERVAGYLRRGLPQGAAEALAEPYIDGLGHHVVPRRTLKAWGIPDFIGDSRFNIVKPVGIDKGQFYRLHYGVDTKVNGGPLRGRRGRGSGWSGRRLGWERYDQLGRIVHGTPEGIKDIVGASVSATAAAAAAERRRRSGERDED
jgi:hypothetical protein